MNPPKRRWAITVEVHADTLEGMASTLHRIATDLALQPGTRNSVFGGCDSGGHFVIEDRGAHLTPEDYRAELERWNQR